jgi:hypothetical protein
MAEPTLHYESRRPAMPRQRSGIGMFLAVVSLLAGAVLAYLFILGFGVGDTWMIYPPHLPLYWWIFPTTLIGWPVWFFAGPTAR